MHQFESNWSYSGHEMVKELDVVMGRLFKWIQTQNLSHLIIFELKYGDKADKFIFKYQWPFLALDLLLIVFVINQCFKT